MSATDPLNWSCRCDKVHLAVTPFSGTRAVCYCKHCRAFARHLDDMETLDAAGGTDLYQTTPDKVTLRAGAEHLACLRLTARGPLRWYTTCCNTRLANTGPKRSLPLVSLMVPRLDDPDGTGRVVARVFPEGATGPVPGRKGSMGRLATAFFARTLMSLATGRFRANPFFDDEGRPVAAPQRLDVATRKAAYDEGS